MLFFDKNAIIAGKFVSKGEGWMATFLLAIIYLAFISLGLPDAVLGAAWPIMYGQLEVPVSYMGILSMTISAGTILASLFAYRLTRRFGTGKVTAFSVGLTALALFGFSASGSFWMLFLWSVPYGLGAGCVDAALNNYVATHYASRHMSWLHCMWGIGASAGPYIMGCALTWGAAWNMGYVCIAALQAALTAVLVLSLPSWKKERTGEKAALEKQLGFRQILAIPGVRDVLLAFFCYCALEQTAGQWASSYLVMRVGVPKETAASLAGLFYMGITVGRIVSGFLTIRMSDRQMIRLGQLGIALGLAVVLLPFGAVTAAAGLTCIGFGCAPIYPCIIHTTPHCFGAENSQAIIGVEMACAYVGNLLMSPLYGVLANRLGAWLLPVYLAALLLMMLVGAERLNHVCRRV